MTRRRSGRDLAFVSSPIPVGRGFDSEQPVFRVQFVNGLEAEVGGVGQAADGEEVCVVMPQPGNLQQ